MNKSSAHPIPCDFDFLFGRWRVRFIWDCRDAQRPRWEQAFSTDQGENWETNWVMTFERPSKDEGTA